MSSSTLLFSTTTLLLLLAATAASITVRNPIYLAGNLCQKAPHPNLCPPGVFKSEAELAVAAVKQAIERAQSALGSVEKLLKEAPGGDKLRKMYLDGCKTHYTDAVNDLTGALGYLTGAGTDGDVMSYLSAALTDIDDCSSEWDESGLPNFPLAHINGVLYNLASNALTLGKGVKASH